MQTVNEWSDFDFNNHIFFNSSQTVKNIISPITKHFGINFFQYYKTFHDGGDIILTTCPKWVQYCFESGLYKNSFFLNKPTDYFKHEVFVSRNTAIQCKNIEAIDAVKRDFGIIPLITITNPTKDGCEFFHFGTSIMEENVALNTCLTHLDLLEKFINFFKEQAKILICTATKNKLYSKVS